MTLQKVALTRVQAMELGTKINIPKGSSCNKHILYWNRR